MSWIAERPVHPVTECETLGCRSQGWGYFTAECSECGTKVHYARRRGPGVTCGDRCRQRSYRRRKREAAERRERLETGSSELAFLALVALIIIILVLANIHGHLHELESALP